VNESRNPVVYEIGDRVMATVQVQSDASKSKVAKLSYQRRGPFEIVNHLGNGAYELRSLSRPDAATLKFHSASISPLPPGLLPCDPIDTSDLRYLNQDSTPVANPLRSLEIQMYNDVWFEDKPKSHPPPFDFSTSLQPVPPFASSPFPSVAELCDSHASPSPRSIPPPASVPSISLAPDTDNPDPFASPPISVVPPSAAQLYDRIVASTDRMFFIQYLPEGTLRPRWYLVAVNLDCSQHQPASATCRHSGIYAVDFYCRHPDDRTSSDACARWWREWHRYSLDPNDATIIFGDQVLFRPNQNPSADTYITWSDVVPLADPSVALLGPFDLASSTPFSSDVCRRSSRQWVPLAIWQQLCCLCSSRGILLPSVSAQPVVRSRWTKAKKRKRTP
jgi:hypothetical protein